jgi:aspartyl-tRNA(Asn)/glutamyl-tRNA(Gln) amidotransferase subunit A
MSVQPATLSEQVELLKSGKVTAVELADHALMKASETKKHNAFVALDRDAVLEAAYQSDVRRKRAETYSDIDGVPIAVKDNYLTSDYPTTACSSKDSLFPNQIDATVVMNLRKAGAVIFGKTNMHEWAYGATNKVSAYGPTLNPHNPDFITGGSSGGSAAAVAAGVVAAALGSDTGGSVRIPASACGVYGFKPTYGRASRYGLLPLSWSLDAPGPIARSIDDIELLLSYFLGQDCDDYSTCDAKGYVAKSFTEKPKVLSLYGSGLERESEVDAIFRRYLMAAEIDFQERKLGAMDHYFSVWETILHCEASSFHEQIDPDKSARYSQATQAHLAAGRKIYGTEYLAAQRLRQGFISKLLEDLPPWDVLATPTLPITVPRHDEEFRMLGDKQVAIQDCMTWFCWIANLSGFPCITLPAGMNDFGLPVGTMLIGKPGRDEELLSIARHVEQSRG